MGGRVFRLMLRGVKPEHAGWMVHMLWLLRHGGKEFTVPKEGRWVMEMPYGYVMAGEGRSGGVIEPRAATGLFLPPLSSPGPLRPAPRSHRRPPAGRT